MPDSKLSYESQSLQARYKATLGKPSSDLLLDKPIEVGPVLATGEELSGRITPMSSETQDAMDPTRAGGTIEPASQAGAVSAQTQEPVDASSMAVSHESSIREVGTWGEGSQASDYTKTPRAQTIGKPPVAHQTLSEDEYYALSGGAVNRYLDQSPKVREALERVTPGLSKAVSHIAPALESIIAATVGTVSDSTFGAANELESVSKLAGGTHLSGVLGPSIALSYAIASRFGLDKAIKKWSEKHNINSTTAGIITKSEAMRISNGRTGDLEKLTAEERDALRSGVVDSAIAKINQVTSHTDSWGNKTKPFDFNPMQGETLGANFGPGLASSIPLMLAGGEVGAMAGNAALESKLVGSVAKGLTGSKVLAPFMKRVGLGTTEEATNAIAALFGNTAGSSVEALFEAGSARQAVIANGGSEVDASVAFDKTFAGNVLLLGFTNQVGPTAKLVKTGMRKVESKGAASLAAKALAKEADERVASAAVVRGLRETGHEAEAEALLRSELIRTVQNRVLASGKAIAKGTWETAKDSMVEGFEEQAQKVISDLAEQGKPMTWDNIQSTFLKNWDEGIMGGLIGGLTGGLHGQFESAEHRHERVQFKQRLDKLVGMEVARAEMAQRDASIKAGTFTVQKPQTATTPAPTVTVEAPATSGAATRAALVPATGSSLGSATPASGLSVKASTVGTGAEAKAPAKGKPSERPAVAPVVVSTPAGETTALPSLTKPGETVPLIKTHKNIIQMTASNGPDNSPDAIEAAGVHNTDTAHTVANRGVAQALETVMFGAATAAGQPISKADRPTIHNIANGISSPNGIEQIAQRWETHLGVPAPTVAALRATAVALKAQGIDMSKNTLQKDTKAIPAKQAAERSWAFLNEFHNQLSTQVQNMGVDAPQWVRATVAKIESLVEPGGKYDTVFRKGMGLPIREKVAQHVPVAPIAELPKLNTQETTNVRTERSSVPQVAEAPTAGSVGTRKRDGQAIAEIVAAVNSGDSDIVKATLAAHQVDRTDFAPVRVGPYSMAPSVDGRLIEFYGPKVGDKRPYLVVEVMADGDLHIQGIDALEAEGKGFEKILLAEAGKIALGVFPEVSTAHSWVIGDSTEKARKSRMSYPGTVVGEHADGGQANKPTGTPLKSVMEYRHERPTDTQRVQEKAAEPDAQRPRVQESDGASEAARLRANETERGSNELLEEAGQPARSPALQAILNAAKARIATALSEQQDEASLAEQHIAEMRLPDGLDEDGNPVGSFPRSLYGPTQLIYPAREMAPGSPFKSVLNLTDNSLMAADYAKALGFIAGRLAGVPGGSLYAQMHLGDQAMASAIRATIREQGFDAIAFTDSKNSVAIEGLIPAVYNPLALTPAGENHGVAMQKPAPVSTATPVFHGRVWEKHGEHWGWRKGQVRQLTADERTRADKNKPVLLAQEPMQTKPPIEDKAERAKAVSDGIALVDANHFSIGDLLSLAKVVGVPIAKNDVGHLIAMDNEETSSVPERQTVFQDREDSTPTIGEQATAMVEFIRDGGIYHILNSLMVGSKTRKANYARATFKGVMRVAISPESIIESERKDYHKFLADPSPTGSDTNYKKAKVALDSIIGFPDQNANSIERIVSQLKDGNLTVNNARILSLAIAAAIESRPNYFLVKQSDIDEMNAVDMERGAYDKGETAFKPLAPFFHAPTEQHDSFMTTDVKTDRGGENFVEPIQDRERTQIDRDVVPRLVNQIAERGGFTPDSMAKAGVELRPKAQHAASYEAAVNMVHESPELLARIADTPMVQLLNMSRSTYHQALANNGYAHLRLMHEVGKPKKAFNIEAFTTDPEFKEHYTPGEDLVRVLNFGTPDGMPISDDILKTRELGILLDSNHPLYSQTIEAVGSRIERDGNILLAGTPHKLTYVNTPTGRVGILVPKIALITQEYGLRTDTISPVDTATGEAVHTARPETARVVARTEDTPARQATLQAAQAQMAVAHQIMSRNHTQLESRSRSAIEALRAHDTRWEDRLGSELNDQIITAQNILEAIKDAQQGLESKLLDLPEAQQEKAAEAIVDPKRLKALQTTLTKNQSRLARIEAELGRPIRKFLEAAEKRLAHGQDPTSVAARARAREIRAVLSARAKSDIRWDEIFAAPKGVEALTFPTSVAAQSVRNREQFLAVAEELGIDKGSHLYEQLAKIDDLFFEELGTNISTDPQLDSGSYNFMHRVIKLAAKMKTEGVSATKIARTMMHELAHGMTAYMSIPMQSAAYAHMLAERTMFANKQKATYLRRNPGAVVGRSYMEDLLSSDAIIDTDGRVHIGSVSEILDTRGSLAGITLTVDAASELAANHPSMFGKGTTLLEPVPGNAGEALGYKLSRDAWNGIYRYTNLAEFIAETMADALGDHADTLSKSRKVVARSYTTRLRANASANNAMSAIHRNIGRTIDALIGKNTMRRFVGYLVNEGGKLDRGLQAIQPVREDGSPDIAVPQMAFKGNDLQVFKGGKVIGAAPIPVAPSGVVLAKRDYKAWRDVGLVAGALRAPMMMALNASSVNDLALAASYTMRSVLGDLNQNYNAIGRNLYKYHVAAQALTEVKPNIRKELIGLAEQSGEAEMAQQEDTNGRRYTKVAIIEASDGKAYAVSIGTNGKYQDATPMANLEAQKAYIETGKFSGPLAGLEVVLKQLHDVTWSRLSSATGNLAAELALDPSQLKGFDDLVSKVKNYLPQHYAPRTTLTWAERLTGTSSNDALSWSERMSGKAGKDTATDLPVFNSGLDVNDLGIDAGMLLKKQFNNPVEAVKAHYFPAHTNVIDSVLSGVSNALGVVARLDAITNLMARDMAVPNFIDNPTTQSWPTIGLSSTGLTSEMFGGDLANIRVHPDAMRVLNYAFRPDFLARTSIGRGLAMASGMINVTQLFGLNDYVNGMAAVQGFGAQLGIKHAKARVYGSTAFKTAAVTAGAYGAAFLAGAAGVTAAPVLGAAAAVGWLGARSVAALTSHIRAIHGGSLTALAEGKRYMQIIESATTPERLPQSARDLLMFAQVANIKLAENPIQIQRMKSMVSELMRQNKSMQAAAYWVGNKLNKPTEWNEVGIGGVGGKTIAKLGMIKLLAPAIMNKYRDANGQVDWSNKRLIADAIQLSDDMDAQVGSIQYRNLHMNPTIVSGMKIIFRAFGFRYTTERVKFLAAADIINAIGSHSEGYKAMREVATRGGTMRPEARPGDMFAWRLGTLASANLFLGLMMFGRLQSMMTRTIWPDSNYSESKFVGRTYEQLRGTIGDAPAHAFSGLLSVMPPEGSSAWEAMRHILIEAVAPQFGPNDPTSGRPRSLITPGAMYARNILEQPWETSWWQSGLSPIVSLAHDVAKDQDALGRPLRAGDPFGTMKYVREFNNWSEEHPGDNTGLYIARRVSRTAAHIATSLNPFFVRAIDNPNSWPVAISQTFGGRTMPPAAGLSAAERFAMEQRYPEGKTSTQYSDKIARSREAASAKGEMASGRSMAELDALEAAGELGLRFGKQMHSAEYSRLKREYFDPETMVGRSNLVRLMRGVSDSTPDKKAWKKAYELATPKERRELVAYVTTMLMRKGATTPEISKDQAFLAWVKEQK